MIKNIKEHKEHVIMAVLIIVYIAVIATLNGIMIFRMSKEMESFKSDSTIVLDDIANNKPGQPLDALLIDKHDRPVWLPDCECSYKVTDRYSNKQWWLLKMKDGSYVSKDI